jgi:hypothetical protein
MKKFGYVYHTFCTESKRHYIGQHVGIKFDSFYLGSGKILWRAIRKYGEDAFEVTPIKWCTSKEELNIEEIWQIARFRKRYGRRMLYNVANGGEGLSSDSWTKAMRENLRIKKRTWKPSKSTLQKQQMARDCRTIAEWKAIGKKIGLANINRRHSKKTKILMSLHNGHRRPEVAARTGVALKGRKKTAEHRTALKRSWKINYAARCNQNKKMWILRKQRYGPSGGNKCPTPEEQIKRVASICRAFAKNPEAVKKRAAKVWRIRHHLYGPSGCKP